MTQTYRVEVHWQGTHPDGRVATLLQQAREWNLAGLRQASIVDLYFLRGDLRGLDERVPHRRRSQRRLGLERADLHVFAASGECPTGATCRSSR